MATDEFRNLLVQAQSVSDVGGIACREALSRIRLAAVNFVPFDQAVVGSERLVCVSDSIPPAEINEMGLASLPAAIRDLDLLNALRRFGGTTFDNDRVYPQVKRTEVYNEFWVPHRVERQMVHVMGTPNQTIGWIAALRSARKAEFTDREVMCLQDIGEATTHAMRGLAQAECRSPYDVGALRALQSAIPWPCFVFGESGTLLWVNEEGLVRLSVDSVHLGGTRFLGSWSPMLESLVAYVRDLAKHPSGAVSSPPAFLARHLAPAEHLAVRRYAAERGSAPTILISLMSPAPVACDRSPASDVRLTPRESEVASLIAQGYSVVNVASILEMSWATVRVHLRRVYAKLGVVNRAQLTLAMCERGPIRSRPD